LETGIWNTKHEMDSGVVWVCNNKKQMLGITYVSWKRHSKGFLCHTMFEGMYNPYKAFYVVLVFHVCASAYGKRAMPW